MYRPPKRVLALGALSILLLTLYEKLDYSHPKDDTLEQSITTPNFQMRVTTYRNRHAHRCMAIRCGSPDSPRTPLTTPCDIVYVDITTARTNKSRDLCAADYVTSQWEAVSRTYNDGIIYISNNAVINNPPLKSQRLHFSRNGTRPTNDWFSLSPFPGGVNALRIWVRQGRLSISCDHGAVECHDRVLRYSCDGSVDPRGCRTPETGASVIRATVITLAACAALWRVAGTARVVRGGRRGSISLPPIFAGVVIGMVGFAGMGLADMAWLVSRMVGVRYVREFSEGILGAGDIYRLNGVRGIYEGYAYVWRDGVEMVRVSGPGVAIVVGWVAIGLFIKRALFNGVLVRCVMGVVGTFCGCAMMEMGLMRDGRKVVEEIDEDYLAPALVKQYVKRSNSRVFVRERGRR